MKAPVGAFNQEKALVGAFSVIVQPVVEPMDRFAALLVILNTVYRISTLYMIRGSVDCGSLSYLISNLRTKEEYIEMAFTILRIFISN